MKEFKRGSVFERPIYTLKYFRDPTPLQCICYNYPKIGGLNFCMDALMRTDGWPYIYLITVFGYLFPVQVTSIKLVCLIVRRQTMLVRERTRERYGHTSRLPLNPGYHGNSRNIPQTEGQIQQDRRTPPENFQKMPTWLLFRSPNSWIRFRFLVESLDWSRYLMHPT